MFQETVEVDYIKCVYCGHGFDGRDALNYQVDSKIVKCPKCSRKNDVSVNIEFVSVPYEDDEDDE